MADDLIAFIRESNLIEGIEREPTPEEIAAAEKFMALGEITVGDVCEFVSVCQPGAVLRERAGMDVRVGKHIAPPGGPPVRKNLGFLLRDVNRGQTDPYEIHHNYEYDHPFTDGNGRSGRMIWAWQMREFPLGFLHHWYYQSLQAGR